MGDDFNSDDTDKFKIVLKYQQLKNQGQDTEEPIYVPVKIDINNNKVELII